MRRFCLVFRHYAMRMIKEPIMLAIFILLPVFILLFNALIIGDMEEGAYAYIRGYNVSMTYVTILMTLLFQFMGGSYIVDYLFVDFRSARRWRLNAAPVSNALMFSGMLAASLVVSLFTGVLVMGTGYVFFDAYLHNPWVLIATLVVVGIIAQLVGILFVLLCKKKSTCEILLQVFAWGQIIPTGMFMGIDIFSGETAERIISYIPFVLAMDSVMYSGFLGTLMDSVGYLEYASAYDFLDADLPYALSRLGILGGVALVLGLVVLFLSRRREI